MEQKTGWITPFKKQCFVVLGVSMMMGQLGLVFGFSSILLPQLRSPDSSIPIDTDTGSWLASTPAMSFVLGNLIMPVIMGKFGRKVAYLTTLGLSIIGWIVVIFAQDVVHLLCARCLQGIFVGMGSALGPLLIGEYSSPINRGVFLMTIAVVIGSAVFVVHSLGVYLSWKTSALFVIGITCVNVVFAFFSPESPSWFANQGRYEECKKIFRWLRGDMEEEELEKMIEADIARRKQIDDCDKPAESIATRFGNQLCSLGRTLKKNEFYKPLLIMFHIYAMAQWSGVNLLASYAVDFVDTAVGLDDNLALLITSLDIQRIFSNVIGLIVIKKMKRRTLIFGAVGLNTLTSFTLAVFTYCKANNLLPFDASFNYYIGVGLIHFLTSCIAIGSLPMSFILAGELFPLQYKSILGGISCLFFSINLFTNIKTVPLLLSSVNVYGMYAVNGCCLIYVLIVVGMILPETKDRTLQDIEEEFKGIERVKTTEKPAKDV